MDRNRSEGFGVEQVQLALARVNENEMFFVRCGSDPVGPGRSTGATALNTKVRWKRNQLALAQLAPGAEGYSPEKRPSGVGEVGSPACHNDIVDAGNAWRQELIKRNLLPGIGVIDC